MSTDTANARTAVERFSWTTKEHVLAAIDDSLYIRVWLSTTEVSAMFVSMA